LVFFSILAIRPRVDEVHIPSLNHSRKTLSTSFQTDSKEFKQMNYENVDRGALMMLLLEDAAVAVRKANPSLSPEQAFSKAYQNPSNREIVKAERQARESDYSRDTADAIAKLTDADIERMVDHERRLNSTLSDQQIYLRVNSNSAVRNHTAQFYAQMQQELDART
jgi:hypothetical protein